MPTGDRKSPQLRRFRLAFVNNALSSFGNLATTVAIARQAGAEDFGKFALATAGVVVAVGIVRASTAEIILASGGETRDVQAGLHRASLLAVGVTVATGVVAFLSGNWYMLLLAVGLHGLIVLDYCKVTAGALRDPRSVLHPELVWTSVTVLMAGVSYFHSMDPLLVYIVWVVSGASVGYWSARRLGLSIRPAWRTGGPIVESRAGLFALDFLAGVGSSQLAVALVASVVGVSAAGTLRGAGTLLAPVAILGATANSLSIALLAQSAPEREMRTALRLASGLVVVTLVATAPLFWLPDSWGTQLLGPTWITSRPLLAAVTFELVFALIAGIAFAGHRAHLAGTRTLGVRVGVGCFRLALVAIAAAQAGVSGAAWAMAATALVGACLWWLSYRHLLSQEA